MDGHISKHYSLAIGLFFVCIVTGCSSLPVSTTKPLVQSQNERGLDWKLPIFGHTQVDSVDEIFALTLSQQQNFLSYFNSPLNQSVPPHNRLYNYLETLLSGFDYRGETYVAHEALEQHGGNCMSLAILTTALANLVDLEVRYQRVNSAPLYQRFDNVMKLSSHVRSHIFEPKIKAKRGEIVFIRGRLMIDYFPDSSDVKGEFIGAEEFYSMYYQNLAGDALVEKDYNRAYANLTAAMAIDGNNSETLNTLAVLYKTLNYTKKAESLYQYVLENTAGSANVLSNYALLLEKQQRFDELNELEDKFDTINDNNPYRWYDMANRHFSRQKYNVALKYYKRSVEVAPYLHEGYFGLAKTYYQIGKHEKASKFMQKASELAYTPKDEYLYSAKLKVLNLKQN